jgi:hypothetical protein
MACPTIAPSIPVSIGGLPVGIPSCCLGPPSTLVLALTMRRTNAVNCSYTADTPTSGLLTFNGTNQYTGTLAFAADTYNVTLTLSGGTWTLDMLNITGGCGFGGMRYNSAGAASWVGPWPDEDISAGGICGCSPNHIVFFSISVS